MNNYEFKRENRFENNLKIKSYINKYIYNIQANNNFFQCRKCLSSSIISYTVCDKPLV